MPIGTALPSAFLTNSSSTAQCKQPASISGNLCIQQFPGSSRSKFRSQHPALPPRPGRVKRGKQKQVAIGALGAGFRNTERFAPRPGLLCETSHVSLSLGNSGLRTEDREQGVRRSTVERKATVPCVPGGGKRAELDFK